MSSDRGKDRKAAARLRPAGKETKITRPEELSPEQRVEVARKAEAKQVRGKPPSI